MDWSYIAGFFDGEGCVSIGKNRRPICTMAQTDGPHFVLEKIQKFLKLHRINSSLCIYKIKAKPNYKPSKTLIITSSYGVEDFLTNCLPYMHVKEPKARQALSMLKDGNLVRRARDESVVLAAKEYALGVLNRTEVCNKHRVGYRRFNRVIKELGIKMRNRWENGSWRDVAGKLTITKHHVRIIRSMPFEIITYSDVAQLLNCHPSTIGKIISEPYWKNV